VPPPPVIYAHGRSALECVHLVTSSYFRSCKKDGGHAIQLAVGENPIVHALCVIDAQLWAMENLTCTEAVSRRNPLCEYLLRTFFGSCDLDLDLMAFIFELDPYCIEIY